MKAVCNVLSNPVAHRHTFHSRYTVESIQKQLYWYSYRQVPCHDTTSL